MNGAKPDPIEANLASVRSRIAAACARSGRQPGEIRLIAVTKTFSASVVERAAAAGLRDIGENRVQELRTKAEQVGASVRWHLIGHLQSNKARVAAQLSHVIHSVDSLDLAEKLAREAVAAGRELEVLIQVNIGAEPQKSGVNPAEVETLAKAMQQLPGLRLTGLMTIPPIVEADETRRYFRNMRELADRLGVRELSMGMTDDFEIAIEEGSTMVRVGRAIFGERG